MIKVNFTFAHHPKDCSNFFCLYQSFDSVHSVNSFYFVFQIEDSSSHTVSVDGQVTDADKLEFQFEIEGVDGTIQSAQLLNNDFSLNFVSFAH